MIETSNQPVQRESFFAGRALRVAQSASNAAGQRARELMAQGRVLVNLTQGEPDFETPDNIKQAAIRAMQGGETRYTNVDGTPALKAAVVAKFERENGLRYAPNQITVGAGAKQIVFNALMASVEEGDEVIIPAPHWVSYPEMTRFAGGVPIIAVCNVNQNFKLLPEQLEKAITPRTKWLILNSPGNPSGAIYSRQELLALGEVLARHPHVWVMTDDIYEHLNYSDEPYYTVASAVPELIGRTLTINGVSKAYAMTGWRVGYAAGPREMIVQIAKIQSQSTGNPCSISQAAAIEALSGPQEQVAGFRAAFHSRRDTIVRELSSIAGLNCPVPDGAFYVFPSCAAFVGKTTPAGQRIENDVDFSAYLLDRGVATVAGRPYGINNHFRLSFATSEENLREGASRIRQACADLS